jgi:hypothetical protein
MGKVSDLLGTLAALDKETRQALLQALQELDRRE